MWQDIVKLAVGNGLWAVLSVVLLSYLLKDSRKREQKYTDIISDLAEKLKLINAVKKDTDTIRESIERLSGHSKLFLPDEKKRSKAAPEKNAAEKADNAGGAGLNAGIKGATA
jgi:hypothetical protein